MTYDHDVLVAQVGWIALLLAETSRRRHVRVRRRAALVEFAGPWIAETPQGRHAVARAPHRRALRPARDHRARRGRRRDDRVALRGRRARGAGLVGRRRRRRRGGHGAHVRHVVDLLHHAVGPGPARAPGAVVRLGLRAHPGDRRGRGDRRRPPRRRLLPRGGSRCSTRPARCCPSSSRWRCTSLGVFVALRVPHPHLRPVPPAG